MAEVSVKTSAYRREPFVPVPLWALRIALAEHGASCGKCSGQVNGECTNAWYRSGLDDWISRAEIGR